MTRMFCTVAEAARTLNTGEDQIRALVERGILQEFREGPHRFLREADIDALDLGRGRPAEARAPVPPPVRRESPSRPDAGQPKTRRPIHRGRDAKSCVSTGAPRSSVAVERRPARRSVLRPPAAVLAAPTVRQWFWMGLVQDRPTALALLSGLVLLGLAALAAGICLLAEGL